MVFGPFKYCLDSHLAQVLNIEWQHSANPNRGALIFDQLYFEVFGKVLSMLYRSLRRSFKCRSNAGTYLLDRTDTSTACVI